MGLGGGEGSKDFFNAYLKCILNGWGLQSICLSKARGVGVLMSFTVSIRGCKMFLHLHGKTV